MQKHTKVKSWSTITFGSVGTKSLTMIIRGEDARKQLNLIYIYFLILIKQL